jgi:hypothetical protein
MKFFFQIRSVAFGVFCLSMLTQCPASAQADKFGAGYVITSKGDSLNGFILIQDQNFNSKTCRFKEPAESELKTYSPNEIKAYGIGTKKRYVAYTIKSGETNEKVFISCIVKGKASLFYFQERYFIDSGNGLQELVTSTTNVTRDGKVYSQPLPVYKGVLQAAMNDCPTIHENLKGTSLKKNDLTKLFEDYHKCIGQSATVYESGAGKIKAALGIALSGQSTGFDINSEGHPSYLYLDNNDPMTDFSLAPTFIAEFYAAEGKGKFRVRTGFSYYTGNYHLYDQGSPGALDHQLTIEMARFELPVILKY